MLLFMFWQHWDIDKTYDSIHEDDYDFGEVGDNEFTRKQSFKQIDQVLTGRMAFVYILLGYALSVLFDKPDNKSVIMLLIEIIVISVIISMGSLFIVRGAKSTKENREK